jgi:hypothetical protein
MAAPYDGESNQAALAGVLGPNNATSGESPAGVFGISNIGEGVHGETNCIATAAIAGIAQSAGNTFVGVWGWNKGNGAGAFGYSEGGEGVHGESGLITTAAVAGFAFNSNGMGQEYGERVPVKGRRGFFLITTY